ncbi:MAG: hypothetical protein JRE18_09665 [Deltaproteobacteria bacterium]|jgi:hypothetical protein|nr:hypothetical protein [Deltaproteobacteria bacterium]
MQIWVTKSDGTIEPYLHTKVLGTLHRAMTEVQAEGLETAQMLSDAVTYFLYQHGSSGTLTTDQIHHMIITVLEGASCHAAAQCLNAHRLQRRLQRRRIEVIDSKEPIWTKSCIVQDLIEQYQIEQPLARAVAGSVEEKVLRMGATRVRKGMIRHMVLTDVEDLMDAHRQLVDTPQVCEALSYNDNRSDKAVTV